MGAVFSTEELRTLTDEVTRQLGELPQLSSEALGPMDELRKLKLMLVDQLTKIEEITKKPAEDFFREFARGARHNICDENSSLRQQWEECGDISRDLAVEMVGEWLLQIGYELTPLVFKLAVAVTVAVVKLGVGRFCKEYGENAS
jgi:hypothetical protein